MTRTQKLGVTVAAVLLVLALAVWLRRKLGGAPSLLPGPEPR